MSDYRHFGFCPNKKNGFIVKLNLNKLKQNKLKLLNQTKLLVCRSSRWVGD